MHTCQAPPNSAKLNQAQPNSVQAKHKLNCTEFYLLFVQEKLKLMGFWGFP